MSRVIAYNRRLIEQRPREDKDMLGFDRRMRMTVSPIQVACYGAAGGLAGTLLITLLARITPGIKAESTRRSRQNSSRLPDDPFNKEEVIEWQDRSRSPAAYSQQDAGGPLERTGVEHAAAVTPAGALAEA